MATTFLSLGSNIGNKRKNIITASTLLAERAGDILALSALYETEPWGFKSDNTFLNAVLMLETSLSPEDLLALTIQIEKEVGRTTKTNGQYQDRIIDIDILTYDNLIMKTPQLTLPHPHMHERDFVLEPLTEIAPGLIHPVLKKSISQLLQGIERIHNHSSNH